MFIIFASVNNYLVATEIEKEKYAEYVKKVSPKSKMALPLLWAFLVGGLICCVGQAFIMLYKAVLPNYDEVQVGGLASSTLVFIASFLTGIGVYDKIGAVAGGGSIVPITGFSNSITAAAMEFRKEGIIYGTTANMFKIAGPVIVVGVAISMLFGLIYFLVGVMM
jgi:stage V sporulation protein AC